MSYETKTRPELDDYQEQNADDVDVHSRYRQALAADIKFDLMDLKAELLRLADAISFIKESIVVYEKDFVAAKTRQKTMYLLLDSDGDIVETFPENSSFDYMFQRKQSVCPYGTLHKTSLHIGPEEKERIQVNTELARPARIIKSY